MIVPITPVGENRLAKVALKGLGPGWIIASSTIVPCQPLFSADNAGGWCWFYLSRRAGAWLRRSL
jgi:hypothetical protein